MQNIKILYTFTLITLTLGFMTNDLLSEAEAVVCAVIYISAAEYIRKLKQERSNYVVRN